MTMPALALEPPLPPSTPYCHTPVMQAEVLKLLQPRPGGLYLDCTVGGGGHAEAILEACPGADLVGSDCDPEAVAASSGRLRRFGTRVRIWHARFSELEQHLLGSGISLVDGLLADLGTSSAQLDDPSRGLSFRAEGPIDMRFDRSSGPTALDLIRSLRTEELADLLHRYGGERCSRRIARYIKSALEGGRLHSTLDLRRAVIRATGSRRIGRIDPATRTFQALRIAVNHELDELAGLLDLARRVLRPGGVAVFVAFHSLDDRLIKEAFRDTRFWQRVHPKPLLPSPEEQAKNPRSRSARLRAAVRLPSLDCSEPVR